VVPDQVSAVACFEGACFVVDDFVVAFEDLLIAGLVTEVDADPA